VTIIHDHPLPSAPAAPTVPCPAWCALPAGHADLIDTNLDRLFLHRATVFADVAGRKVGIWQSTTLRRDGRVEQEQPQVVIDDIEATSVADTRRLIAGLALAAELAESQAVAR
jgi:hypothetical protein